MADEVVSNGQQIASEVTLQRLLDAVAGSGDSAAAVKIKDLAKAADVASDELAEYKARLKATNDLLTKWFGTVLEGTATTSGLVGSFSNLKGPIGVVASAFSKLLAVQEENFATYQKITSAGANFGGSLTDLRLAAMNTFLTLDQFANLIKTNSNDLITLGGSVNGGAKAFAQFSGSVMQSGLGKDLLALGYTTEGANQAMITYLGAMGVNNAEQLRNDKTLREGTGQYLEELDRLAQITGKSREELNEKMKKEKLAGDIAMTAARIQDPKERAAFRERVRYMNEMYGDAGKEVALASQQGRAVRTKEAQLLQATVPGLQKSYKDYEDATKKYGAGSKEAIAAQNKMSLAMQEGFGNVPETVLSANDSFKGLDQALRTTAEQQIAGLTDAEKFAKRDKEISEEMEQRKNAQSASMAEAMMGFKELGLGIMKLLSPFVQLAGFLGGFIGMVVGGIGKLLGSINVLSEKFGIWGTVVQGVVTATIAYLAISKLRNSEMIKSRVAGLFGGGGGGGGSFVGPPAPTKGGGLGGILGSLGGGGGGAAGGGMLEGLAAGLKAFANPQLLLGAAILSASIAILGLGIGAAIMIVGKSLPTMAEGLQAFTNINGDNLVNAAKGIALLGPALVLFTGSSVIAGLGSAGSKLINFFTGGGPISQIRDAMIDLAPVLPVMQAVGPALNEYSSAIVAYGKAISTVDIAKAERLKEVMKGPGVLEGIGSAIKEVGSATAKLMTGQQGGQEKSNNQFLLLNSSINELIKVAREISDYTKQTVDATKNLNGDHFA